MDIHDILDKKIKAENVNKINKVKKESEETYSKKFIKISSRFLNRRFGKVISYEYNENCHLPIIIFNNVKIGIRIRRPQFIGDYKNEFTISIAKSGRSKSEFDCIINEKCVDYIFHAFEHLESKPEKLKICNWIIVDTRLLTVEDIFRNCQIEIKVNKRTKAPFVGINLKSICNIHNNFIYAHEKGFKY